MTRDDLIVGRVYSAKQSRQTPRGFCNDRMIVYIGTFVVQYDAATLSPGRRYLQVDILKFLRWAGRDVTIETPDGTWRDWENRNNIAITEKDT